MSDSPTPPTESDAAPPSFEAALSTLQQITARLEEGSGGLEGSLADFERGVRLLRVCYQLLENAEQKIEQLVHFSDTGEPVLAPFDATATAGQPRGNVAPPSELHAENRRRRAVRRNSALTTNSCPALAESLIVSQVRSNSAIVGHHRIGGPRMHRRGPVGDDLHRDPRFV